MADDKGATWPQGKAQPWIEHAREMLLDVCCDFITGSFPKAEAAVSAGKVRHVVTAAAEVSRQNTGQDSFVDPDGEVITRLPFNCPHLKSRLH